MDEQQQRRVNEAAEQFATAMIESYQTMADRGVSAQEINAQLTQQFFNTVIDSLQRQVEESRGTSQELADQAQRAQQATQTLTQESMGAYMDFLNSMLSFYQGATAREAEREAGR